MKPFEELTIIDVVAAFGVCAAAALIGAIALLISAARQIMEVDVPEDADFFETLQVVPIAVPLALDLLDFAFDIFAAPISWFVLEMLGLRALQMITIFEGLIPGTQLIPTMTVAWLLARAAGRRQGREPSTLQVAMRAEQQRRDQLYRGSAHALADGYRRRPLLTDEVVEGELIEEEEETPFD